MASPSGDLAVLTPAESRPDRVGPASLRWETALSPRGLVAAASWMSGSHLLAQAFAYSSLIILARLVPPASFGTVAAATAIVWMTVMVMDSGIHGGIVVRRRLEPSYLRRAFLRCFLVGSGLGAAMTIGAPAVVEVVARGGDASAVAALGLAIPMYAVALVPMAILHRMLEFRKLAQATAVSNAGSAAAAVVAGLLGAGVWALVTRQLLWFGLLAAMTVALGRAYLPSRRHGAAEMAKSRSPRPGNRWFLLFGVTLIVIMNLDYLVIGSLTGVSAVGLYAMAFMIAFAPVQHFSNEVGKVLFAAAAATDLESSGARTVHAMRLMAVLLLPLLPAAIVLAPSVLPAVLGSEWIPMVVPFQLLLVVGIARAIVSCIGEALSGLGEIAFRAKLNVGLCVVTLAVLVVLVRVDGIRGAALAHLAIFVPYALVYLTTGARRAGTTTGEIWRALRPALSAVAVQAAVTSAVALGSRAAGVPGLLAASAGAAAGLAIVIAVMARRERDLARQGLALLRAEPGGA